MIIAGICLRRDWDGLKLALAIRGHEKQFYIKKTRVKWLEGPSESDPIRLTEAPTGKIYEPEDIEHGEYAFKGLEPDEI